jgi:hypothetical protein
MTAPYGETRVDVVPVQLLSSDSPGVFAAEINAVVARFEACRRLVVGPPQVLLKSTRDVGDGVLVDTWWVVVETRPGPPHPTTGFPGEGSDAMLDRHGHG